MTPEIADAINNAMVVDAGPSRLNKPSPRHSATTIKAILKSVARDLPPDMTMSDLLEELGG